MSMPTIRHLAGGADRIAVVDTETTGVYDRDRVVEIAIVTMSLDGQVIDIWESLIQPERDVGPTHIHGITASMLAKAPVFGDLVGDISTRLQGACLAAHNLPFDERLLRGEFSRLGIDLTVVGGVDTLAATASKLALACAQYSVPLVGAHRARTDALATAELLVHIAQDCTPGSPAALSEVSEPSGLVLRRQDTQPVVIPEPPLITYLASRLGHVGVSAQVLAYLELVDRAVADLHLDSSERAELAGLAARLGLTPAEIVQAHRRFVNELIDAAVADHELTDEEYSTLVRVAAALEIDQQLVERRTKSLRQTAISVRCHRGLTVAFTGNHPTYSREALEAHAERMGMTIGGGVTKKTDLLVAADPNSESGNATKAHRYGVPVVGAADFASTSHGGEIRVASTVLQTLKVITCPDCLSNWTVLATSRERTSKRCTECQQLATTPPAEIDLTRLPPPSGPPIEATRPRPQQVDR